MRYEVLGSADVHIEWLAVQFLVASGLFLGNLLMGCVWWAGSINHHCFGRQVSGNGSCFNEVDGMKDGKWEATL